MLKTSSVVPSPDRQKARIAPRAHGSLGFAITAWPSGRIMAPFRFNRHHGTTGRLQPPRHISTLIAHPAHRTGGADFPHPALGQDFTPSPTAGRAHGPYAHIASNIRGVGGSCGVVCVHNG